MLLNFTYLQPIGTRVEEGKRDRYRVLGEDDGQVEQVPHKVVVGGIKGREGNVLCFWITRVMLKW